MLAVLSERGGDHASGAGQVFGREERACRPGAGSRRAAHVHELSAAPRSRVQFVRLQPLNLLQDSRESLANSSQRDSRNLWRSRLLDSWNLDARNL